MILAFILAGLTLSHRVQVWHIFVLSGLLGVVNAFDIPARQSFLVDMVGKEDLMNAIALNSSMFNGARIVGPAIAGVLVASIGEGWCFFANAVSYIAVIIGLLMIHVEKPYGLAVEGSPLQHIVEGFRFVMRTGPILTLLVLLAMGFTGPVKGGMIEQLDVELDQRGNVATGADHMSSTPGVIAAGDMRRGQSLVVWAIAEGRKAARGIDRFLMGETNLP